ncbi:MAG: glycoside hydrolase family 172 protein, partial [Syntrophothermus sp.]
FFPLPFEETARIEIVNESAYDLTNVSYQVDYQRIETYLSKQIGYFHAFWRRDIRTDYDSDFVVLKTRGRGHIVGLNLNIQSYNGRFDYLSGIEKFSIDGEKRPSLLGTGIDDLFMGGKGFERGRFTTSFSGLIDKDDSLGRISAYRFMVQDAIPFKKSIFFSIEHGRANQDITDFSSTVYWYQSEPHQPFPPIAKNIQRIPLRTVTSGHLFEAENLNIKLGNLKARIEDMSAFGPEWSGAKGYLIESSNGSEFTIDFPRLEESAYDIEIYYTRGPEFGNVAIYHDKTKIGKINGYAPAEIPGGKITIKNILNPDYNINLRFVVEGKDSLSTGYFTGLDGINLNPKRTFIPEWKAFGPFTASKNSKQKIQKITIDNVFPPEQDLNRKNADQDMKQLVQYNVKPGADGYISLDKLIRPNQAVINYLVTNIYSPEAKIMYFYIGSDDAVKVFFNGKQVYRYNGIRFAEPDQGQVYLRLQKGWNTLMLKVLNHTGNSGIYARILDREQILKYSIDQKLP